MMTDRETLVADLCASLIHVGFVWEKAQRPHRQKRTELEHVFLHPGLLAAWRTNNLSVRATKFYIKPLSDDPGCEFGLVTGGTSPLYDQRHYAVPNAIDTHGSIKAWVNRAEDPAMDRLLVSIVAYLERSR
jgi:hypothetical protein